MTWVKRDIFLQIDSYFCDILSIIHTDANVFFSVHCPAACANANYIVYGSSVYRGVCEYIV